MDLNTDLQLDPEQYYPGAYEKSLVFLHHTVGGTAASTFRHWNGNRVRVGTAYQVARDGEVFQHFPAKAWAWSLGVSNPKLAVHLSRPEAVMLQRRTIDIELSSYGALLEKDGKLWAFPWNPQPLGEIDDLIADGTAVHFPEGWRGYHYFATYTGEQWEACTELVDQLCEEHPIPRILPATEDLVGPADLARWQDYQGVLHHAMVRPDKSDLHPGADWLKFAFEAGLS